MCISTAPALLRKRAKYYRKYPKYPYLFFLVPLVSLTPDLLGISTCNASLFPDVSVNLFYLYFILHGTPRESRYDLIRSNYKYEDTNINLIRVHVRNILQKFKADIHTCCKKTLLVSRDEIVRDRRRGFCSSLDILLISAKTEQSKSTKAPPGHQCNRPPPRREHPVPRSPQMRHTQHSFPVLDAELYYESVNNFPQNHLSLRTYPYQYPRSAS